jgi:hypothetical protein|tara:strand:- start:4817 stop:5041 length:225 start_codon:yes stop_codon:yes gene_type:complete
MTDHTLDLHGLTHTDVESNLESWLIMEYNQFNFPLVVITGNSTRMKQLVYQASEKQEFKYKVHPTNSGALIIYE